MPRFVLQRACKLYLTPEQDKPYRKHFVIDLEDPSILGNLARFVEEVPEEPSPPPEEEEGLLEGILNDVGDQLDETLP